MVESAAQAASLRARAKALRLQGVRLKARADRMPEGTMRHMLTVQAQMLQDGAREIEARALEFDPALGTA